MIRTQIYIPDDIHENLLILAKKKKTSLSVLIREGAEEVLKKNYGNLSPQKKALKFFADPPSHYQVKFKKRSDILIRAERD